MRALAILLVAIGIAAYFWLKPTAQAPHQQTQPTTHSEAPAPQPSLPPPVTAAPIPAPEQTAERTPPPQGTVPFKLYGNLVVAFGDQLLGTPNTDSMPEQGFIVPPKIRKWDTREIAFSVHPDLPDPDRVMKAIEYLNTHSQVQFVPLTNQTDSIVFAPSPVDLCLSYVGKVGGHQPIYLDHRCQTQEILHEIMHALGFIHEHSRPDRDQFVKVHWDRIIEERADQFEIDPSFVEGPHKDRPFDYESIMIYEDSAFAKSRGQTTLESRSGQPIQPSPEGLSPEDLNRLNSFYAP